MAIILSLTKAYAQAIYLDGTKRFTDIRPEYGEPVKQHAGLNYTVEQIDNALDRGFIAQVEHDETINYKNEVQG